MIPEPHKRFVEGVLARFGVPLLPEGERGPSAITAWMPIATFCSTRRSRGK